MINHSFLKSETLLKTTFSLKQHCMLCSTKDIKILIRCNNMQDTASPDLDQLTEGEGTVPSSLSGQHARLGDLFFF